MAGERTSPRYCRAVRYQRVVWHHDRKDEPVVLFNEIGGDNYERRKVEEYRDGTLDYADGERATGSTLLGDQEMPPLEEINADPEFSGEAIDAAVFERVWEQATGR